MSRGSAEVRFPPLSTADEDGLLLVGGSLSPQWLIEAYRRGIFPWPLVDQDLEILAWFSPDPRAIFELDAVHVPKRLARRLRRGEFEFTMDQSFTEVMAGCADRPEGTWITRSMNDAYQQLHQRGLAHSIEAWQDGRLVGGIYGVGFGAFFSAESMFHRVRDASKACLAILAQHLQKQGYHLLDIQQNSPHCQQMGATEIPRRQFLKRLKRAWTADVTFQGAGRDRPGRL